MRALLSLCSGRAAGADGRSRRVLRGNCQRGRAPVPARHRFDRAERFGHLSPRDEADRRPIRHLAPYVGGKTGTSENENDAWFVGFSNEVTIAVWVGYDNAGDKRRTLGSGATGAKVAVPIFASIVQAAWSEYAPRTLLSP